MPVVVVIHYPVGTVFWLLQCVAAKHQLDVTVNLDCRRALTADSEARNFKSSLVAIDRHSFTRPRSREALRIR